MMAVVGWISPWSSHAQSKPNVVLIMETSGERLYDLSLDLAEQNNVIDQHPEIAAQMRKMPVDEGARKQP